MKTLVPEIKGYMKRFILNNFEKENQQSFLLHPLLRVYWDPYYILAQL